MNKELIEAYERELHRYTNLKKVSVIHIKLYGVDMMESEYYTNVDEIARFDEQIEWLEYQLEGMKSNG